MSIKRILPNTEIELEVEAQTQWQSLPWDKFQVRIKKIQMRIYHDTKHGKWKQVRDQQRLLLHSMAAKALVIRKITQKNRGKLTAGLDGHVYLTAESNCSSIRNKHQINLVNIMRKDLNTVILPNKTGDRFSLWA